MFGAINNVQYYVTCISAYMLCFYCFYTVLFLGNQMLSPTRSSVVCVLLYLCWVIHPYSLRSSLRSSTLTVCMVRRYQRPRSINSSPLQKQWYVCGVVVVSMWDWKSIHASLLCASPCYPLVWARWGPTVVEWGETMSAYAYWCLKNFFFHS